VTAAGADPADRIFVRHPRFDFSDLPRHWLAGSPAATHLGNAGHVFIPLGEQFFIDTVKGFRDRVSDPALRRDVNAFLGQEAVHKRAHEDLWERLRSDGVPIDDYAAVIGAVRRLERVLPAPFRLSVTAALEHYTAVFGHSFLTEDLSAAVPDEMARLLAWHGHEEIEHRSVAFDVLRTVDGGYALRVAGFVFASGLMLAVPAVGGVMFALADPRARTALPTSETTRGPGLGAVGSRFLRRMAGHLVDYLRPTFHPGSTEAPPAPDWLTR
jgi:uncharacterized protein